MNCSAYAGERKIYKIGVFGLKRGTTIIKASAGIEGISITAICDSRPENINGGDLKQYCADGVGIYDNFDEFIESGIEAVVLSNYFNEHAKYALRALNKGIHVLSETTAAPTLGECVELCEAVENSGAKYMLAANMPFSYGCLEIERLYREGTFGRVYFAEAEYFHPSTVEESHKLMPGKNHWRRFIPRTYYNMHTLGPLMQITGTIPVKVNAKAIYAPEYAEEHNSNVRDIDSVMLYEMDNGAVFRTTGWSSLGPTGKWIRLSCAKGTIETARDDFDSIRFAYNPWHAPEGAEVNKIYKAVPAMISETEKKSGHGGSDHRMMKAFAGYLDNRDHPFFDVYNSASLSAAAIIAWRSVLNNGSGHDIIDFHDKNARKVYAADYLTPFPDENGKGMTLPCSSR
ncbi:MAG: Gfo/Idh/MocA family oxidoreductase [Eubacteriales bacterium]|nr:Gfo/Idh/MocA family oxidoreductase [Eubacteriales bacterium]